MVWPLGSEADHPAQAGLFFVHNSFSFSLDMGPAAGLPRRPTLVKLFWCDKLSLDIWLIVCYIIGNESQESHTYLESCAS